MNTYGIFCEEKIRDLLPEIGIPHKFDKNGGRECYWWASKFEDHCPEIRTDCWITLIGCGEVAVDFTVLSPRNGDLLQQKITAALNRGVVPIVLEQRMVMRAADGSERALQELGLEVRGQISLKLKQLKGPRMTRERVAELRKQKGR